MWNIRSSGMHAEEHSHTNRLSQSGADMRPKFDHHNAPPMEPPLVGGMPHVASEAFVSEAQAGEHVTESRCTHECAAVVIVAGKAPHPALDS